MLKGLEKTILVMALFTGCTRTPAPSQDVSLQTENLQQKLLATDTQTVKRKVSVFDPTKYPDNGKPYNPNDYGKMGGFTWDYKVLVLPGDNLVKVAREIYGDESAWKYILSASQEYEFLKKSFNPATDLHAGQWLLIDVPHAQAAAYAREHPKRRVSYASHGPQDSHF